MTGVEYFDLVDNSGRMTRSDKRGGIAVPDADMGHSVDLRSPPAWKWNNNLILPAQVSGFV